MTSRWMSVLVGSGILLLAKLSPAQTNEGSVGPPRPRALSLGIEAGLGIDRIEKIYGNETNDWRPSTSDSGGSLSAGLVGQLSLSRVWSLGPRLSADLFFPPTYSSSGSFAVEAGLLSVFHLHPSDTVGPRPRILLGADWSWETLAAPRSFAIQHTVSPASGVCGLVGLGFERMPQSVARQWSLDLRFYCGFEHEHSMLDTRTQERRTESLDVHRSGILLTFRFGWFLGGGP